MRLGYIVSTLGLMVAWVLFWSVVGIVLAPFAWLLDKLEPPLLRAYRRCYPPKTAAWYGGHKSERKRRRV